MKKLVYIILFLPLLLIGQTTSGNFVKKTTYKVETKTGIVSIDNKTESITYFDGLGRAKQHIEIKAGGQKQDIITHIVYDELGRQKKEYLPLAATSNGGLYRTGDIATATNEFYITKYRGDFTGVALPNVNAYSEKEFDNSPLNRVLKQAAPGHDWRLGGGHEIQFEYETNTASEVKQYSVSTTFANNTYS
ncbi:MAG: DUF6443 domain-containing protein, partial [Polaribacter sp.]